MKTTARKFPNLWKDTDIQVQKAQRVLSKMNWKKSAQDTWQLKQ